jgi:glycosyltransferase involved in cell wall biosynthesis
MVHNYYQKWGGEDQSTEEELALLQNYGHEVELYRRHNDEIKDFSKLRMAGLFLEPIWSPRSYREVSAMIERFKPDVIHCQNFFVLISPALFYAAARKHVPIIYTLRDYRLLCPIGWFLRDGQICEECLTHSLLRGIQYGCYHGSSAQTASIALMLKAHRVLDTWNKKVNGYICLTEFSRQKFIQGGLPAEKIVVRPNFMNRLPELEDHERSYALFVGRLSSEKGIQTLIEAWRQLPDIPLKLLGEGDMLPWAQDYVKQHQMSNVEFVGFVKSDKVLEYQRKALFLIMPSVWYETFGRVILEAYSVGTPAIVSNLGAMPESVEDGKTGLLFNPGDADDLARKVRYAMDHRDQLPEWGRNGRRKLEMQFTADVAHQRLIAIYQQVVERQPVLK